jgi:imidazolonepropionase
MRIDSVWRNARLVTMDPSRPGLGVVLSGAVACAGRRIVFAGVEADLPPHDGASVTDCAGRWITPGLIDCHTHLVHAGDRAAEFAQRLAGESYEAIARAGGGILSTVRAVRAADQGRLVAESLPRLDALLREGVTTVEIKSGYGLDLPAEQRMLRAARALGRLRPVGIATSYLGAHTIPPEFNGDADGYVDWMCADVLPVIAAEGLADAVDAFCETVAFSPAQTARIFDAARTLGLPVKLHADQLSDGGGAALAAQYGALSADHLEYTSDAGAAALGASGTVAVLLPGAFYTLRETHLPPVDALRRHGVAIALATDCNPGSSPLTSPLLAMNMAATLFRLTVEECLAGFTRHAARALGLAGQCGALVPGTWCDLAIWDVESPAELVWRIGFNPLHRRVWRGE